jgi:hypothetical protein
MDGEGIVWLIAVGWVILSWIMKAIRGAAGQAGRRADGQPATGPEKPDAHELRERRARLRAERARRRLNKTPSPREDALQDLRRELERVMGVHVEEEHGPTGRRATVRLEPDEDVEEVESLEEEPVVTSLETFGERAPREDVDQDSQAEEITRRRHAVAEAHSRPLTRADHRRFDQRIRETPALEEPAKVPQPRQALRQAFIWSEVLGKPVSDRKS